MGDIEWEGWTTIEAEDELLDIEKGRSIRQDKADSSECTCRPEQGGR